MRALHRRPTTTQRFGGGAAGLALLAFFAGCSGGSTHPPPLDLGAAGAAGSTSGAAGAGGASGGAAGASGGGQAGGEPLTHPCPLGPAPALPGDAPRILVLGPSKQAPDLIAMHLAGMLASDPSFAKAEVVGKVTDTQGGRSLMSFFYDPTDRDARLSVLEGGFTWVVLLDDEHVGASYPELAFEGARVLSCRARTAGAKPLLLMTWSKNEPAVEARAEHAYRVGNGTGTPVVPTGAGDVSGGGGAAGSPQVPAGPDVEGALRGAAAVYIALSGHAAAGTTYMAPGFAPAAQAALLAQADAAASLHASLTHYTMPYASAVRLETGPTKGDFTFMDSGTSSEALWHDRMNEIVPKLGMTPKGTAIGACNDQKVFDAVCLANAQPSFAAAQFQILFARSYAISAADVLAAGKQKSLTVQIWDRHYDGLAVDGLAAIGAIDERSMTALSLARAYGLAWTPYHLTFAKLKTARPAVALTTDGTHATYPVSYALAAMSMISRTSMQLSTAGLDDDTAAAVRFADETVRQVARLSVWEAFVPDDPATRPKVSP